MHVVYSVWMGRQNSLHYAAVGEKREEGVLVTGGREGERATKGKLVPGVNRILNPTRYLCAEYGVLYMLMYI